MAAIQTSQTQFGANEQITSAKLNNILLQSSFAAGAVTTDGTLTLVSGQMQVGTLKTANFPTDGITTAKIADGAVTAAKLASSVIFVPSGAVMAFAMNSVPTGWLFAEGTAVSRSTYANLFAAIGTTYGSGDGSTTFNLPDLRGYFVRGAGTNSDGTAAGTFGAKQADDIKSHKHSIYSAAGDASDSGGGAGYGISNDFDSPSIPNGSAVLRTNALGPPTGTGITNVETRPKNITMLYCIKI
jgi:microcystin-dependent protein